MRTSMCSLENKAQDIENALARHDFSSSRMYAHELGIRLEHAQQELELSCRSMAVKPSEGAAEMLINDLAVSLVSELERLRGSLIEQRLDAAQQAFAKIRSLLAQLALCVGDA